jgi:hypothetical protein
LYFLSKIVFINILCKDSKRKKINIEKCSNFWSFFDKNPAEKKEFVVGRVLISTISTRLDYLFIASLQRRRRFRIT